MQVKGLPTEGPGKLVATALSLFGVGFGLVIGSKRPARSRKGSEARASLLRDLAKLVVAAHCASIGSAAGSEDDPGARVVDADGGVAEVEEPRAAPDARADPSRAPGCDAPCLKRPTWIPEGWFVPVGMNLGVALHDRGRPGLVVGAEVSVVRFPVSDGAWLGFYGDALFDSSLSEGRLSLGPELGWGPVGIDGGLYRTFGPKELGDRFGVAVRLLATLGIPALYTRFGSSLGDDPSRWFVEVGALVKYPFQWIDTVGEHNARCRQRTEELARQGRCPAP